MFLPKIAFCQRDAAGIDADGSEIPLARRRAEIHDILLFCEWLEPRVIDELIEFKFHDVSPLLLH